MSPCIHVYTPFLPSHLGVEVKEAFFNGGLGNNSNESSLFFFTSCNAISFLQEENVYGFGMWDAKGKESVRAFKCPSTLIFPSFHFLSFTPWFLNFFPLPYCFSKVRHYGNKEATCFLRIRPTRFTCYSPTFTRYWGYFYRVTWFSQTWLDRFFTCSSHSALSSIWQWFDIVGVDGKIVPSITLF